MLYIYFNVAKDVEVEKAIRTIEERTLKLPGASRERESERELELREGMWHFKLIAPNVERLFHKLRQGLRLFAMATGY